ncbi:MAG: hypothetical protein JNL83_28115 [Myxococcales bacterium]|nr:hypothetical protein [Myxococcales bacterium]
MPALVFDRERLERNVRAIAEAARAHGVTALFAAKSFPHADVLALAHDVFDGIDAASPGEVRAVPASCVLSVADPSGRAIEAAAAHRGRLIVSCDSVEQVTRAPAHAEIAIRISASLTARDPAVGAVLDGSGHRRSRFGLDVERERRAREIRAMTEAARGRRVGVHVHHGPVTATSAERFVATARAVLDAAREAELAPAFVNLGGAWHGLEEIGAALAEVRATVGTCELIIEPGRTITRGAGFARGRVLVARELDDRPLFVLDLSRICHLRWSQVELVAQAPHPGEGRRALFAGPTCFEDDVIGEWTVTPPRFAAGARVVLSGVSGYAVAWNTGFGGVAPAEVVIGDANRLLE